MDTSRLIVQDVRIFDGITDRLSNGHVLVEGRTIAAVDTSPIAADAGTTVIDGGGRVLMPGLADQTDGRRRGGIGLGPSLHTAIHPPRCAAGSTRPLPASSALSN